MSLPSFPLQEEPVVVSAGSTPSTTSEVDASPPAVTQSAEVELSSPTSSDVSTPPPPLRSQSPVSPVALRKDPWRDVLDSTAKVWGASADAEIPERWFGGAREHVGDYAIPPSIRHDSDRSTRAPESGPRSTALDRLDTPRWAKIQLFRCLPEARDYRMPPPIFSDEQIAQRLSEVRNKIASVESRIVELEKEESVLDERKNKLRDEMNALDQRSWDISGERSSERFEVVRLQLCLKDLTDLEIIADGWRV
ncbi:hypothetical protein V5O48_014379 [Marasmius crinis-equi]|uniref:Uncharacterized protein n=1 Tax=Marasmius crinis-equi TaxID=585013 RepID=A0ABR3EXG3_9AGAR